MLKKIAAICLMAVALTGQAQTVSFDSDAYASFAQSVTTPGSSTYTYTFEGLTAGVYDIVGSLSSFNFDITNVSFNGVTLPAQTFGNFSYASIEYTGASPFVLSITGTLNTNSMAGFSGSLSAVSPVPEPEAIAMMLAGLGVIGAVVRRRNRVAQPVTAFA